MKSSSLRWWRERGWLQSTSPTVSPARTTLTSPSASTSEPVSAVSWSSSSLFRRQKQGESVVSFSGSWEAIKFTNRSLPIDQQNTISHISHQGRQINEKREIKKVFSSREKSGYILPFHLVANLPRAAQEFQIGKSAFLCFLINYPRSLSFRGFCCGNTVFLCLIDETLQGERKRDCVPKRIFAPTQILHPWVLPSRRKLCLGGKVTAGQQRPT